MPDLGDLLDIVIHGREHGTRARARRVVRQWLGRDGGAHVDRAAAAPERAEPPAPPVPDGFTSVLPDGELGEGGLIEVMVDDEPVALCRVGGEVFAVSGVCPHAGGPIGDGSLQGHQVTCPYHGYAYDVRDGSCLVDESVRIETRPVRVVGGRLCVGEPGG